MKQLDLIAHLLLYLGLALGIVAVNKFQGAPNTQFVIILAIGGLYLLWGMIFHYLKGDLQHKLLLEYLIIAAIAAVVAYLVFLL